MTTQLIKALEEDNERLGGSPNVRAKRLEIISSIFRQTFVETLKKARYSPYVYRYEVLILHNYI